MSNSLKGMGPKDAAGNGNESLWTIVQVLILTWGAGEEKQGWAGRSCWALL